MREQKIPSINSFLTDNNINAVDNTTRINAINIATSKLFIISFFGYSII